MLRNMRPLRNNGIISNGLINFLSWGINLVFKKELKGISLKVFLVICYLTLGTVFIYITFNNSVWLIDNGNSGFVGKIGYIF